LTFGRRPRCPLYTMGKFLYSSSNELKTLASSGLALMGFEIELEYNLKFTSLFTRVGFKMIFALKIKK
jgi:hypothetical protein